jgi:hypothetical protein
VLTKEGNIMFENDIISNKHFTSKADTKSSYTDFLLRMYINAEDFPFEVKTGKLYDGREVIFQVRSWGYYQASNWNYICFVAYYCPLVKHTVQYSWACNAGGLPVGEPHKYEWIA